MKESIDPNSKVNKVLINEIAQSLFASGHISENDIKDKNSIFESLRIFFSKEDNDIKFQISHTENLVSEAKKYKENGQYNYSRIFYSTYFEHQINGLIDLYCSRNEIDKKTKTSIIQSVNIGGKFTWLIQLLKYPKFNSNHLRTIRSLADSRNSFVHYKWHEHNDSKKENIDKEFENIEKAVKYFKNYSSRIKYKGKKGHLKEILK